MRLIKLDGADHAAVVAMGSPPADTRPMEFIVQVTDIVDRISDRDGCASQ